MNKLLALSLAVWVAVPAMSGDRMVGLVEIPALHRVNATGPDRPSGPVPLFAKPEMGADVAVVVRERRELESREHDYEQVSAVVYDREGSSGGGFWFKLRHVREGEETFGWLSQGDAGKYRHIGGLIGSAGLTYFTKEWDGRLYARPDRESTSSQFTDLADRPSVKVAATHYIEKELWLLVVRVKGTFCSDGGGREILGTGWVPAYSENGRMNVWYYSRGC